MNNNHYVAIMAGGIGSRFWPVSRHNFPKQFLDILNTGKTLIQATYDQFCQLGIHIKIRESLSQVDGVMLLGKHTHFGKNGFSYIGQFAGKGKRHL